MPEDDWVQAAIADDALVAELLMRLKRNHSQAAPLPKASNMAAPPLPLGWGSRQSRSKPVFRCAAAPARKEKLEPTRGSPATPLSWSGGTGSHSATADGGFEESSRPEIRSSAARSKGIDASGEAHSTTSGKRLRRKRTFSELKDEETRLLKERKYLRKKIAALRANLKEQRVENARLKRIKIDFETALPVNPRGGAPFDTCKAEKVIGAGNGFLLPDLNAMPSEEDCVR